MSNPPILPAPRTNFRNGNHDDKPSTENNSSPSRGPGFLAPFLGAFAAVFIIALVAGGIYLALTFFHGSSGKSDKSPLQNVAQWHEGPVTEGSLAESVKPDIGWWARTFSLPQLSAQVSEYLNGEGLTVNSLEPIHYTDNKDTVVLTYQVTVSVPGELFRVPQAPWIVTSGDDARFSKILVLNQGLPPGIYWDTRNARVEASANAPRTTLFNVRWDKATNIVTADRLLPHDLVNQQEITAYQTETQQTIDALNQAIQQIDTQVAQETQARLAQIPPDPPKPDKVTANFGGDGSGEPTKSAERIGGSTLAGAGAGALIGSGSGNAGKGAGIGAGIGLLGGIIYDAVSKSNDKEKLERQVADENAERMDEWHSQIKALNAQRAQIKKNAPAEREAALNDLANRIVAAQGHLDQVAPPANGSSWPSSSQPSGPIPNP